MIVFFIKKIDGFFIIDLKPLFIIFIFFTLFMYIGSQITESKPSHSSGTDCKTWFEKEFFSISLFIEFLLIQNLLF